MRYYIMALLWSLALVGPARASAVDSLHIRTVGTWSLGGSQALAGCRINGQPFALAGSGGRLVVLDVADHTSPLARGDLSLTGIIYDISEAGTTAFLALGDRVVAVDISNPARPALLGSLTLADSVLRLSASGGRLYLAAGPLGVLVVDAANPARMSIAGACPTPERAVDVAADGSICYTLDDSVGLLKIDASVATSPHIMAQCPLPDSTVALEIAGGTGFVASRYGVRFSAITAVDLDSMVVVNTISIPQRLEDISLDSGYLLAATGDSGVHIYDVRDARDLGEAGYCQTQGSANRAAMLDSLALAGDAKVIMTIGGLRHLILDGSALQGCYFNDLALSGSLAYVADAAYGLRIFDISNPASPAEVGGCSTPGEPQQVVLQGGRLYLADGSAGVRIYNLADPGNPVLLGWFDTPGTANGLAVLGANLCIADGDSGLTIYNITDPANPVLWIRYNIDGFQARKCAAYSSGSGTWVGLTGEGATLVSVRIFHGVNIAGYYPGGPGYRIEFSGSYLCVITDDEFLVFKKPTERFPAELNFSVSIPSGSGRGFARRDSLLFTANGEMGFQAQKYRTSKKGVFSFGVGHCPTPGLAQAVVLSGGRAWLADGPGGLKSVEISLLSGASQGGWHQLPLSAFGLATEGNRIYICDPSSGLWVLDASVPGSPRELGYCPLPGPSFGAAAAGDYAFVANGAWGLRMVDVSDPCRPNLVGAYDTSGFFYSVCVRDTLVFAAAESSGLLTINVSDPGHPTLAGWYDTPGVSLGVALAGDLALVADGAAGLQLLDISDPTQPRHLSSVPTLDCTNWVAVNGRLALVADGWAGLTVVDISDPSAPRPRARLETGGYARQLAMSDSICYIACSDTGLLAVNLADPADPQLAGWYRNGNHIWAAVGLGPYQAISDDNSAVRIIQGYGLGRRPPLPTGKPLRISPNPFAGQARIEFKMEKPGRARAAVYNILGQQLEVLLDGPLPSGAHWLVWPVVHKQLTAGIYLLRLEMDDRSYVGRLVMVK